MIKRDDVSFMQSTCVSCKDNATPNDSDHVFVIRKNICLKHRCPFLFANQSPHHEQNYQQISAFSFAKLLE